MKNPPFNLDAIREQHRLGNLEKAKADYLAFLKQEPNHVEALHWLGLLYAEEGDLEKAEGFLRTAWNISPDNMTVQLHLANLLKARKQYSDAISLLEQLIQQHPKLAAAYNNLGTLYYLKEQWQKAIDAYQAAIRIQADYVDAYYNLGLAYLKTKQIEQAKNTFKAVLELSPEHVGAYFQMGRLAMQERRYIDAITQFHKIETKYPHHLETQTNLATSLLKLARLDEAKHHYMKAAEIDASDTQVLFNLGVLAMQQGKLDEAGEYYLKAVKVNPDLYDAHHNLAFIALTKRNVPQALLHFREALRIQPSEAIKHTIRILSEDREVETSPPEYVRDLFDSYADHFDAHLLQALHYQVPTLLLNALTKTGGPLSGLDVLDIGCGTGLTGEQFKSWAKSLTGIDISENMLAIAKEKDIYDKLYAADILPFLRDHQNAYDLILAGDVLVYYGKLDELLSAIYQALRPGGRFAFNVESGSDESYQLLKSGRFAHQKNYIEDLFLNIGFDRLFEEEVILRTQDEDPVKGHLFVVQRKD